MNLPEELKQFDNVAYFASSPSEWVTSRLFLAWTIFFVHSLRIYRLDNGMHLRKQNAYNAPCYLYLDGHKSRLNSEDIEILYQNNVRVIVFPSHTTHVLQPFDVALASPLKNAIRRFGSNIPSHIEKKAECLSPTAKNRYFVVHTLIDAWSSVCTMRNIEGAWAKTGLYPFDFGPLEENRYIRPTQPGDAMHPPSRGININGMEITTPQTIVWYWRHYHNVMEITFL